jgi:hypothetical protein
MKKKILIAFVALLFIALSAYLILKKYPKSENKMETSNSQEETPTQEKTLTLQITKKKECESEKKYYFTAKDKRYYLSCLTSAWLVKSDKISFDSAISNEIYSMDKVFSLFQKEEKENYTVYTNETARIYECQNGDVIIGASNLAYQDNFCTRDCTFTKTYYVLNVEEYDKDTYNVTLQYKDELGTVKIKKSLNQKYTMNAAYEFTFTKDELDTINDSSMQSIFQIFILKSVKKTEKEASSFITEEICGINS